MSQFVISKPKSDVRYFINEAFDRSYVIGPQPLFTNLCYRYAAFRRLNKAPAANDTLFIFWKAVAILSLLDDHTMPLHYPCCDLLDATITSIIDALLIIIRRASDVANDRLNIQLANRCPDGKHDLMIVAYYHLVATITHLVGYFKIEAPLILFIHDLMLSVSAILPMCEAPFEILQCVDAITLCNLTILNEASTPDIISGAIRTCFLTIGAHAPNSKPPSGSIINIIKSSLYYYIDAVAQLFTDLLLAVAISFQLSPFRSLEDISDFISDANVFITPFYV